MGEDGDWLPEDDDTNGIRMGRGGGSVASLTAPDMGGNGVEMDNNDAGREMVVPDDKV